MNEETRKKEETRDSAGFLNGALANKLWENLDARYRSLARGCLPARIGDVRELAALFPARPPYAHIAFLRRGSEYGCTGWGMTRERGSFRGKCSQLSKRVSFAASQRRTVARNRKSPD